MRKLILLMTIAIAVISCKNEVKQDNQASETSYEEALNKLGNSYHSAKALEAIDGGSYTYVRLSENGDEIWAAISARPIEVGATYFYKDAMEMKNFESKALARTFESIWFINDFAAEKPVEKQASVQDMGTPAEHKVAIDQHEQISVEKAEGGYTLAEIFEGKSELENKVITVKGQVVKINPNIMKTNWIHIQDGTKYNDLYDLTVTTNDEMDYKLGDIVTFTGTLKLNIDFGHGYQYDFLLQDARLQ